MSSTHVALCLVLIILRLRRSGGGAGDSLSIAFSTLAGRAAQESDTLWHMAKRLTN